MVKENDFVEIYNFDATDYEIYQVHEVIDGNVFCYSPSAVKSWSGFHLEDTDAYKVIVDEEVLRGLKENFYQCVALNE